MVKVQQLEFNNDTPMKMKSKQYCENWPVVYIINNNNEAYIGETANANIRTGQHLINPKRKRLNKISVISSDDFNKSVILDLESYLINYMSSDGKFKLQNSNRGMLRHNYYNRASYVKNFEYVWAELKKENLVENSIEFIQNSELFKYSPYKSLSADQYLVVEELLHMLCASQRKAEASTILVKGGAGTGKTVLAIYLMKLLSENNNRQANDIETDFDEKAYYISYYLNQLQYMKIGLVIPMQSLRTSIKSVFKSIQDLNPSMVVSPLQVPNDKYDLLIVDEAHRLRQRKALSHYPSFDKNNKLFGFGNEGTELDWIIKSSKNQILFYDSMQSVKPSDIYGERFDEIVDNPNSKILELTSQFRCEGGNHYIDYVKSIFSSSPPKEKTKFHEYDFKIYSNVELMVETIKRRDKEWGLSRTVAGYSWKWRTKNKKGDTLYDIQIGNNNYRWNSEYCDWVNSANSVNEIGCIHTIQGYDLNYTGVIIGNEIKYDWDKKRIVVDKSKYYDLPGKRALKDDNALVEYIGNIYKTLLTRGIKGTYIYACDEGMQKYLMQFIDIKKDTK